jgi:hypothetical protein
MKEQVQNEEIQEEVKDVVTEEVKEEVTGEENNQGKEEGSEEPDVADYYKDKYFDTKSKVRKIYAERQKLYNENQQIKELYNSAALDNMRMQYNLMQNDLSIIKQHRENARAAKDTKYLDMADDLYTKIIHDISAFERENPYLFSENKDSKENNKKVEEKQEVEDNESIYTDDQILSANMWLEENPELNVKSKSYNPPLERKMVEFMDEFNEKLYELGRGDEIMSDRYIEVLNEAKEAYKEELRKPKTSYKKSGVSGVRSNMATNSNDSLTIEPWERAGFAAMGVTEAQYLKAKAKYNK